MIFFSGLGPLVVEDAFLVELSGGRVKFLRHFPAEFWRRDNLFWVFRIFSGSISIKRVVIPAKVLHGGSVLWRTGIQAVNLLLNEGDPIATFRNFAYFSYYDKISINGTPG